MANTIAYAALIKQRELFRTLVQRDFRVKYKGSALGVLWSLAHPAALTLVYFSVFSLTLATPTSKADHYWLFLLSGLSVWVFFATALQASSRAMLENANLIKKVRFPRQLLPLSVVVTEVVGFSVMLLIVILASIAYTPGAVFVVWLTIPVAFLTICLVSGLSLAIASLNAIYRDVEHLVTALLLPLFFVTPILYARDSVPGAQDSVWLDTLLHYGNVVTVPVELMRQPLYSGHPPPLHDLAYLACTALGSLALGSWVFNRLDDAIASEM